jgi:hypothetical protein
VNNELKVVLKHVSYSTPDTTVLPLPVHSLPSPFESRNSEKIFCVSQDRAFTVKEINLFHNFYVYQHRYTSMYIYLLIYLFIQL